MRWNAHAKINLTLRVVHKRSDGFHEIETLMTPISLGDILEVDFGTNGIEFRCDDPSLPSDESNLVVCAAKLFCAGVGRNEPIKLTLHKRIPHAAGLGGGSSDAAATLLALDDLFETQLSREQLMTIGSEIGSDVPFFLLRSAAICRGRGEKVEPCDLPQKLNLLLIKPPFGISTAWAYQRWENSKELPGVSYEPQDSSCGKLFNDLERPVFEKFIFLAELKRWLSDQPEVENAMLSGSGSTLYVILRSSPTSLADRARVQFGETLWITEAETV
jgi:4-diphosphocytidyl-2-C-methyl-D-erythritol kinase